MSRGWVVACGLLVGLANQALASGPAPFPMPLHLEFDSLTSQRIESSTRFNSAAEGRLELIAVSNDEPAGLRLVSLQGVFSRWSMAGATRVPPLTTLAVAGADIVELAPRYDWMAEESRAFWYSAAAAGAVSGGMRLIIGLPVFGAGLGAVSQASAAAPVLGLALTLGLVGLYSLAESLVVGLAELIVFNAMSRVYEGDYLTAVAAHFAGNIFASGAALLTFGGGLVLLGGLDQLREFTGGAGIDMVTVFSVVGALPAVVVVGIALIAIPALLSSWAVAVAAKPRDGYLVDPNWQSPTARAIDPSRKRHDGDDVPISGVAIAIPGT